MSSSIVSTTAFLFINLFIKIGWQSPQSNELNQSDTIIWNCSTRLSFGDFKGVYDIQVGRDAVAYTIYNISIDSVIRYDDSVNFYVYCKFYKNESSIVIKDSSSLSKEQLHTLLSHEQLHFDIGEKYARLLRRSFINLDDIKKDSYKTQVFDSLVRYSYLCENEQNDYDVQTNHSQNEEMQIKWNEKIAEDLYKLSRYEHQLVSINLE